MRNIIVCTKIVPKAEDMNFDPETKTMKRSGVENQINEADKNAIELSLKIKEKNGGRVVLLSMGPPFFEQYLKIGIAMGADDAILLSDRLFAGADTFATSATLAAAIRKIGDYDLVLCGEETSDGGTGQVPSQLAELLDLPQMLFVSEVDVDGNNLEAKRTIKGGYEIVESGMPAILSIELGINQPRFPDFKRKRWADKEFSLTIWSASSLEIKPELTGTSGSYTIVKRLTEYFTHQRQRISVEGTAEQQANKIMEILREYG